MARFVNETGSVLTSFEHGWQVGPGGELDWAAYDPGIHGATPGLRRIDEPAGGETDSKPKRRPRTDDTGTGDTGPADATTDAAAAASEETPR